MSKAHMQWLETWGSRHTCRATPAMTRARWYPGPQMALPILASSLLSTAVTMEPRPKALLETQMPVEATAAPGPKGPLPLPLENRPDSQRSPSESHCRQGRSQWHLSSLFLWLARLPS